jgi:hypothetical protein
MHFHLPKPLHGWREFAGEVGIIVVGVLIALGAEQVVEHFRDRAAIREAEDGMASELRDDDLPQAFARVAVNNCNVDQLDSIEAAVESNGDRSNMLKLARAYKPEYRTWDDQAWKSAMSSQALANGGAKRMTKWATAYVTMPLLDQIALQEQAQVSQLWANMSGAGPLTATQQDRMFQLVASLRRYNRMMAGGSLAFMKMTENAGISLSAAAARGVLAESRSKYGACVQKPSTGGLDLTAQFTSAPLRY